MVQLQLVLTAGLSHTLKTPTTLARQVRLPESVLFATCSKYPGAKSRKEAFSTWTGRTLW